MEHYLTIKRNKVQIYAKTRMNPGNIMLSKTISMSFLNCSTCFWNCSTGYFSVVFFPRLPGGKIVHRPHMHKSLFSQRIWKVLSGAITLCKTLSLLFHPINSIHHFTNFYLFLLNLARLLVSVWVSLPKKQSQAPCMIPLIC